MKTGPNVGKSTHELNKFTGDKNMTAQCVT